MHIRKTVGILTTAVMFMALPWTASAKEKKVLGIEVMGGFGLGFCAGDGDDGCDLFGSSYQAELAPGYRANNWLGLYLDLFYGITTWEGEGDYSASIMGAFPTVRVFHKMDQVELFGALGVGYYRQARIDSADDGEISWWGFKNARLGAGLAYAVRDTVSLGFHVNYLMSVNGSGQACSSLMACPVGNPGGCVVDGHGCEANSEDVTDLIQTSLFVRFTF